MNGRKLRNVKSKMLNVRETNFNGLADERSLICRLKKLEMRIICQQKNMTQSIF